MMTEKRPYWLITAAQTSYLHCCCYQAKCTLGYVESVACVVHTLGSYDKDRILSHGCSLDGNPDDHTQTKKIQELVQLLAGISQNKVIKQIISINRK